MPPPLPQSEGTTEPVARSGPLFKSGGAKRAPAAPKPVSSVKTGIASGLLGFVAGVVFWHFVGFWSFVSAVVFNQDREPVHVAESQRDDRLGKPPTTVFGGIPGSHASAQTGCTTLRLDRGTGRTSPIPCEATANEDQAAATPRDFGDLANPPARAPHVAGWAATIRELQAPPAPRE